MGSRLPNHPLRLNLRSPKAMRILSSLLKRLHRKLAQRLPRIPVLLREKWIPFRLRNNPNREKSADRSGFSSLRPSYPSVVA